MKIYTKAGDTGETGLYGGERRRKDDVRVAAYGTVDECNAALGCALVDCPDHELAAVLLRLQGELFEVGADLATPLEQGSTVPRISAEATARLEQEIDLFTEQLEPLRHFILPGGSATGAWLHFARAVCRRAERHLTTLTESEPVSPEVQRYLNRLSDHLFILARLANSRAHQPERRWERPVRVSPQG